MAFHGGAYARYEEQDEPGLYLVYPQDERVRCTCDIFIIHGLHGGTTKTWKHPESGNIWFRDLLPNLIRHEAQGANARIWAYGYPANVTFQTQTIYDFAQALLNRVKDVRKGHENRKIIWICHSMGGLVLKQALIDAKIHVRFNSIRDDTAGIIFMGTPHQGSGAANLGAIVSSIVSSAMPGIRIFNQGVLRDLKRNNNTLFGISSQFSNLCSGIYIHSFHETMPMGPGLIVDRTSSVMLLENEVKRYGLNANHREMCRFRDARDQNWLSVGSSIVELVALTSPGRYQEAFQGRRANSQPMRGLPYPDDSWATMPGQPMYATQPNSYYVQPNIPRRPVQSAQSAYQQQQQAYQSPNPRDRPLHAPPRLPDGWVSQWDPETTKYFFVELATGVVQWDAPPAARTGNGAGGTAYNQPPQAERLELPESTHQRSASTGSTPARLPYPSVRPEFSREDLGTRHRSQENLSAATAASKQESRPAPHTVATEPVYAQETSAAPPIPGGRPAPHTAATEPVIAVQEPDPNDPSNNVDSATCDGCLGPIKCWQSRTQCTVCYDYDLCISCFQKNVETKEHKHTHKVSHIVKSQQIMPDDLIPVSAYVNPEFNSDRTKANWSIHENKQDSGDIQCTRLMHLYGEDAHARYLTSAKPGHYAISVVMSMGVSSQLSDDGKAQLRREGAGCIRLTFGTVKNKKQFFNTREAEDSFNSTALSKDDMPPKLFNGYWWDVVGIDIDSQQLHIQSDAVLTVEGEPGMQVDVGIMIQWSGCPAFQTLNDPVITLALDHVRIDDLLDYNEPHIRAPAPSLLKPGATTVQAQTATEEPELSDAEALAVFVQLLREAQDAQQREQIRQQMMAQIQQEQEQARQELLGQLFLQALGEVLTEQQQERERQEAAERQRVAQQQQQALLQALQGAVAEQEMIRYLQSLGLR